MRSSEGTGPDGVGQKGAAVSRRNDGVAKPEKRVIGATSGEHMSTAPRDLLPKDNDDPRGVQPARNVSRRAVVPDDVLFLAITNIWTNRARPSMGTSQEHATFPERGVLVDPPSMPRSDTTGSTDIMGHALCRP